MRLKISFDNNRITKTDFKALLNAINKQIEEKGMTLHANKRKIYTTLKNKSRIHRFTLVQGNRKQLYYYLEGMRDFQKISDKNQEWPLTIEIEK